MGVRIRTKVSEHEVPVLMLSSGSTAADMGLVASLPRVQERTIEPYQDELIDPESFEVIANEENHSSLPSTNVPPSIGPASGKLPLHSASDGEIMSDAENCVLEDDRHLSGLSSASVNIGKGSSAHCFSTCCSGLVTTVYGQQSSQV